MNARLHHCCNNVATGNLERAIELFTLLGCPVVYRPSDSRWVMVGQPDLDFALQIAEVSNKPIDDIDTKCQVHVAFVSTDPQAVIDRIEAWATTGQIAFRQGGWSERERYFDLPDVFVNFVIEVMHTSILEES